MAPVLRQPCTHPLPGLRSHRLLRMRLAFLPRRAARPSPGPPAQTAPSGVLELQGSLIVVGGGAVAGWRWAAGAGGRAGGRGCFPITGAHSLWAPRCGTPSRAPCAAAVRKCRQASRPSFSRQKVGALGLPHP